jgi:hypothetical protein
MSELSKPIVTESDVLAGLKVVEAAARDGSKISFTVKSLDWRTAIGATFRNTEAAILHVLEHCIDEKQKPLLDRIIPLHLVWLSNVAQQLTNGVDAAKKANAVAETPAPLPTSTPNTSPSSVN